MSHETSQEIENIVNERMNRYTLELSEHLLQTVQGAVKHEMNTFTRKLDDYIKDDMEWKERANPAVDFFVNVTWSKKFILAVIGFMAALFGLITLAKSALTFK